ncbi:hypothetical protein E6C76_15750 [Pseudothauera nasutitermitis]|uniref:Uncharacterized protein n=1 Tax=Pseudothauera nasutitermitis TaxID=2565930 RepID=A0A4S4AVG5_9RHOO|nr:PP0621 family protein [Pseudothauera nasutitermitis]THF64017.1 hypothetical protein E6C76_15750 [Pseudothauera nasutitermitis]
MRTLLIFILVVIAVWWVRNALRRMSARRGPAGGKAKKAAAERMLACRHCGVHVPESEGVRHEGAFYCSEEHRRLGSGRP